jgi:O-antigen/teichoic acid export membrane protein
MLMLGVLSSPKEVGLYSAAYRVLNQVLATYYLLTSVLYPHFARQRAEDRMRMLRPSIIFSLLGVGIVIASMLIIWRRPLLTLLFGDQFAAAAPLLLLLTWAIPLDFLTSYLNNAYIAWGMDTAVLSCISLAATCNVILNLIWIPTYGATAAAINTLICYGIFLFSLTGALLWVTKHLSPIRQGTHVSISGTDL